MLPSSSSSVFCISWWQNRVKGRVFMQGLSRWSCSATLFQLLGCKGLGNPDLEVANPTIMFNTH